MAAKRPASDAGGAPPLKKVALGPIDIGPSSGEEDLDMKILQVNYTAWWCQLVVYLTTIIDNIPSYVTYTTINLLWLLVANC